MRRLLNLCAAMIVAAVCIGAAAPAQGPTFVSVDVHVNPAGTPLAAWQIRVTDALGNAVLVGVEGGEDPSFAAAPTYDPAALRGGAVVIAGFDPANAGPSGKTRVARLHFIVEANAATDFSATAEVIASDAGPIAGATLTLE